MRNIYNSALKSFMHYKILNARYDLNLTQYKMAEYLAMDPRSYANIDNGTSLCSTVTFVLFLIYVCKDPYKLIDEIRDYLEEVKRNAG